jgi:hypothetical protein
VGLFHHGIGQFLTLAIFRNFPIIGCHG